ncbi:peptidoglycan-recognition protein LD isoform X2 [Drosophila ficusphila]|uniref:peptidoglycan-recognition protein LD isoform X2 n=1 Tax=Drosophila ficusphila TaxID=30025 RepID=UPI0007E7643D|nr:peptidoglycan-recognition protein LD isoform X2 [Drosophila ficusphila]
MESSHLAVIMASRSPSPAALSQSSYGSFGSVEELHIRVDKDCGVSESTPLLAATQRFNKSAAIATSSSPSSTEAQILSKDCFNWCSVAFLLMCASALGLAIYLLWRQTQMPDFGYRLSLVEHDVWSEVNLQGQGTPLNPHKIFSVFFTHTESEECSEDCPAVLHNMQSSFPGELPYNFLIAGDCLVFEARGWRYESSYSKNLPLNSSLVIAFVGDFNRKPPSNCQLKAAEALILECLKRRKLQPDYKLFVIGNHAEALQQELKNWPHYCVHKGIE